MKGKKGALQPSKGKQSPKGKGNGKGKDNGGKSMENVKAKDPGTTDMKECPLNFPKLQVIDHVRMLPRYTVVLSRAEEEGLGMDDLDVLQLELESLLSASAIRRRTLNAEIKILSSLDEKKPQSPGKRGKIEEKPIKKFKDSSGKAKDVVPSPFAAKPPKSKNISIPPKSDAEALDTTSLELPRPVVPKNDTPNRFWIAVDPYCTDITQEDIKFLEDLIRSHSEDAEYQKIPMLGKHYTLRWAQEDLLEEQKESAKISEKKKGMSNGTGLSSSEAERFLKRAEKNGEDTSPFGPLTQRLVSALIEGNIMTSVDESMDGALKKETDGESSSPSRGSNFGKSLGISNAPLLERRIKRELEEQGILDADETGHHDQGDDEILAELKRCQCELKAISVHNLQQLNRVLKAAKEEMMRQELRKKLQQADSEVMEAYRRVAAARQKKKSPTKKEKDQAWKALKEREIILKQLESA